MHRILIVLCLALTPSIALLRVFLFAIIQIVYIANLVFIFRPFDNSFAKILKLYRETCLLIFVFIILGFSNDNEKVSITFEYIFITALLSSSIIWFIGVLIKRKINKRKEVKEANHQNNENSIGIEEDGHSGPVSSQSYLANNYETNFDTVGPNNEIKEIHRLSKYELMHRLKEYREDHISKSILKEQSICAEVGN